MELYWIQIILVVVSFGIVIYSNSLQIVELEDFSLYILMDKNLFKSRFKYAIAASVLVSLISFYMITIMPINLVLFTIVLAGMSMCDLNYKLIPDRYVVMLFAISMCSLPLDPDAVVMVSKIGIMLAVVGAFIVFDKFFPNLFGYSDILIFSMIGLLLGGQMLFVVFSISTVSGAILGKIRYMITGNNEIPFVPYITLGFVLANVINNTDKFLFIKEVILGV